MSSREAFEKYVEEGEYLALDRDPSGEYCDRETQSAWEGWQAATERAAKVCDELRNKIPWVAETQDRVDTAQCCAVEIREGNN